MKHARDLAGQIRELKVRYDQIGETWGNMNINGVAEVATINYVLEVAARIVEENNGQ